MKNIKQLALVGLLSFGIAQADFSLNVAVKKGGEVVASPVLVAEDGQPVSLTCDNKTVSIIATSTEDGVAVEVALDGHLEVPVKTVQLGECAEFSCEETDYCLTVTVEQE